MAKRQGLTAGHSFCTAVPIFSHLTYARGRWHPAIVPPASFTPATDPDAKPRELNLESDLANLSFDAALCRWGLMLLPNLEAAIANIYSSLVSGGRFAAAVWAEATKVPIISLATSIISSQVQMPVLPSGLPNAFSLADTSKLENSLAKAGFKGIQIDKVIVTFEFESGEDYSRYCQAVSASARIALSKVTEERKEDIWRKVAEEAVRNYGTANGQIKMDNESICIVGTRP